MWKKTGAWFYKSLPSYEKPQMVPPSRSSNQPIQPRSERSKNRGIKVYDSSSDEYDDDNLNDGEASPSIRSSGSITKRSSSYFLERMNSLRFQSRPSNSTSSLNEDGFFYRKLSSLNLFGRSPSSLKYDSDSNGLLYTDCNSPTLNESIHNDAFVRQNSEVSTCCASETSSINEASVGVASINSFSNQICREQPMGWLDVSLTYTESEHTLDCFLLRARDLPAIDITSPPDPYARLNIVTQCDKVKHKKWLQSRTVHKTRCPELNETLRFFGVEPDELVTSFLYVVLLDDDKYGSDFLGMAKINLGLVCKAIGCDAKETRFEFYEQIFGLFQVAEVGSHRMSLPLSTQDQFCLEASAINHSRGSILVALSYNTKRRSLAVQVKRCVNLLAMDNNGFSDPFVKV